MFNENSIGKRWKQSKSSSDECISKLWYSDVTEKVLSLERGDGFTTQ